MRKFLSATLVAVLPLCATAQTISLATLRAYATKTLAKCPDSKVTLEPLNAPGPAAFTNASGFSVFDLNEESSDPSCQRKTSLLYSQSTHQILVGTVFPLPPDSRPVNARIAEVASDALKEPVTVSMAPITLPDGLHAVSITKQTKVGPFSYHGFLDVSQQFLIIGSRGNLNVDPAKTLVDSLMIEHGVRRGNPKSKIQIIELSDFECPTCARAHKTVEPIIARNVNKIDYYRLDLPLFEHHEWALNAALGGRGIASVAPSKYWAYASFVFENQETIGKSPSFDTVLKNFCEDHDIDWKKVEKIYRSPTERNALLDGVSRAFDNGIASTPTYIVNGRILGFGPEGTFTVDAIKKAIGVK